MFSFADIPNLHSHTLLCKHATGYPVDYCEVAEKHTDIIGFSDHCPFPDNRHNGERMLFEDLSSYGKMVEEAKTQYPNMHILSGVEVEWFDDISINFYTDTLRDTFKMDYLIGSAHYCIDKTGKVHHFSNYKADIKTAHCFCDLTLKLIESGLFEFIAHPDAFMVPYDKADAEHEKMFREIISAAIEYDMPLELNATGIRYKRNYPCRRFWEIASEYSDLQTIINSDAHKPKHLFDDAVQTALDMANEFKLNICNCNVAQKIIRGKKK